MEKYGQNIRLFSSMYFCIYLKEQSQTVNRRPVAHLYLDLGDLLFIYYTLFCAHFWFSQLKILFFP